MNCDFNQKLFYWLEMWVHLSWSWLLLWQMDFNLSWFTLWFIARNYIKWHKNWKRCNVIAFDNEDLKLNLILPVGLQPGDFVPPFFPSFLTSFNIMSLRRNSFESLINFNAFLKTKRKYPLNKYHNVETFNFFSKFT